LLTHHRFFARYRISRLVLFAEHSFVHSHLLKFHRPFFAGIVEHGDIWRLVSATFSHLDFMHILFNMSSLAGVAAMEAAV
jgi:membrane associated rhomboid family serine protease